VAEAVAEAEAIEAVEDAEDEDAAADHQLNATAEEEDEEEAAEEEEEEEPEEEEEVPKTGAKTPVKRSTAKTPSRGTKRAVAAEEAGLRKHVLPVSSLISCKTPAYYLLHNRRSIDSRFATRSDLLRVGRWHFRNGQS